MARSGQTRSLSGIEHYDLPLELMACTALAPEIIRHDLMPCSYLRLYCAVHGEIRVAAVEEEPTRYKCPVCGIECDCTIMARGGTRRSLPCFDVKQTANDYLPRPHSTRLLWHSSAAHEARELR